MALQGPGCSHFPFFPEANPYLSSNSSFLQVNQKMSPLLTTQNPTEMDSDIISKCDCLLIPWLHGFQLTIPIDWPFIGQSLCHPNAKLNLTLPKDYLKSGIKSHQLRKTLNNYAE